MHFNAYVYISLSLTFSHFLTHSLPHSHSLFMAACDTSRHNFCWLCLKEIDSVRTPFSLLPARACCHVQSTVLVLACDTPG